MKILPNFFYFLISFLLILLFLFAFFVGTAYAALQDDFQTRKNQMLADDTLVWAWLEKCQTNFAYYNDLIWQHHDQIWNYYATRSRRQGLVHMVRARYQYPQCFTQAQLNSIDQFLSEYFTGALYGTDAFWTGAASANQQISVLSSMYLYAQNHPDAQAHYVQNSQSHIWEDFNYEGRTYVRGNYYNLLAFSRDYLYFIFNKYITKANYEEPWDYTQEMDSRTYAISQMKAILLLRDLAQDATMAQKADMTFTQVVLNAKMNFSAKHWGGPLATREYDNNILDNSSLDLSWALFGDWTNYKYAWADPIRNPKWDYPVAYDSDAVALISPKAFDPLLLEIGNVDNETDNAYAHWHIEKNSAHTKHVYVGSQRDSANWMYATKYYNLGGNRNEWVLQVRPKRLDPWGQERAYAFRFWVDNDYVEGSSAPADYMGKANIQYKNALFILAPETRRVMAPEWYIDSQSQAGGWTFYRINTGDEVGSAEVVVAFKDDNRALEVCVVGVDCPSFEAFKSAILTKASVSGTSFTTSKGDVISTDGNYNYGLINGRPIWEEYGHPIPDFPLLTTYDKNGNKMIAWDWNSKKLTLSRNGQTEVYDFVNWTTDGGVSPTHTPTLSPSPYCGDGSCNGSETCFSCFADCGSCPVPATSHPYFVSKQSDFDKIKNLIQQGREPWKKQYDKVISEANGIPDQPDLWDLVKLQNADWDEYKNKADNGSARLAKLALAYILSGDSNIYAKAENHLLGWTNESYLRILDSAFTSWNHSHPLDSLVINIALAYDWMYGNANFSQSEKNQVLNWLNDNDGDGSDDAATFIKERHEAEYRSSNQKAWDNAALMLAGLALNDTALINYVIDGADNHAPADSRLMNTKALMEAMISDNGNICDSYYGCKELWHSLLTLNAFSLLSSAATENGYENLFNTQAKLVKSFEFYAPVYQTNDINSLGEGFGTVPDWLYFSGVYEIAYKYLPNNSVIKSVLTDSDFNEGNGRYCENSRSQCSRWTKYPNLIWGQDLSAVPPTKKGDLNNDGRVDIFDYNLLTENFGITSCGNVADIDKNCKVDIFDYNILLENFGAT